MLVEGEFPPRGVRNTVTVFVLNGDCQVSLYVVEPLKDGIYRKRKIGSRHRGWGITL